MERVLAALSGGVDSAVAAALLLEAGYRVVGCMGIMHDGMEDGPDMQAARNVASRLGIPFCTVDVRDAFERHVVEPFCASYAEGRTPSPCVECNRFVKFGALQRTMDELGCAFMATGHYARIVRSADGSCELRKASYARKDQSYMLARLTQEQLSRTLFPLGGLTKGEVREKALRFSLQNAERPESQDICFIPDGDHVRFMERRTGRTAAPGNFIDSTGAILGAHRGITHYTIGQRKGIGLAFGEPRYVCAIDACENTVTIGTADDLLAGTVHVRDFSWIAGSAPLECGQDRKDAGIRCTAKLRYRQQEQAATAHALPENRIELRFSEPQHAVAPGQYAVLYDGARVLGAGVIE